jgi:hypothetical protein
LPVVEAKLQARTLCIAVAKTSLQLVHIVRLGAIPQSCRRLLGRQIPLRLRHHLEPEATRSASAHLHARWTHPTRNLRTDALRRSGGLKCRCRCATSPSGSASATPSAGGVGRWWMPMLYANEHRKRLSYRLVRRPRMSANAAFSSAARSAIDGTCRLYGSTVASRVSRGARERGARATDA